MEDSVDRFAQVLGLESEAIAFLREYPAELQGAIIAGFDASGSKDGNVLGRLQSYSRHLAKRTASNSAAMATAAGKGSAGYVGGNVGKESRKYHREILLLHWENSVANPSAQAGDPNVLKAMAVPPSRSNSKKVVDGSTNLPDRRTPSPEVTAAPPVVQPLKARSAPPTEAPPPPPPPSLPPQVDGAPSDADPVVSAPALAPRSQEPVAMADRTKLIRPAALDAALEQTPVRKAEIPFGVRAGLNADAPEFVPGMQAPFSPAAQTPTPTPTPTPKQPRTPLSLAATIAGPEEPPSPPPRSPLLRGLPPVFGVPPMSPLASPWTAPPPATEPSPTPSDDDCQAVPPPLQRSVTTPVGHVAALPSSPDKSVKTTFEYHLHRLLYMLVARRCSESEAPTEEQGLLVNSIRAEWTKVYGSDMEALMEKCGHKEVEPLVRQIDGLRVVDNGLDLRVITSKADTLETASAPAPAATTAPPTPSASRPVKGPSAGALGATVASSSDAATSTATTVPSVIGAGRRKPPPPPPAAPPPALLGIGGLLGGPLGGTSAAVGTGTPKVLSLDQHVESPAGKVLGLDKFVPESPSGQTSQWGALSFGNSPGMLWNPQGWPSDSPNGAATLWYPGCPAPPNGPPLSAGPALAAEEDVGPPPAHDAPTLEPLSSSAF